MNALTKQESGELARLESRIKRGMKSFLEVGEALMAIREKKLYRLKYGTFDDYCRKRWKMGKSRAYQLCAAAARQSLDPNCPEFANEHQARVYRGNLSTTVDEAEPRPNGKNCAVPEAGAPGTYEERARSQHKAALGEELKLVADQAQEFRGSVKALRALAMSCADVCRHMGLLLQSACNHERMTPEFYSKNGLKEKTGLSFDEAVEIIGIARKRRDGPVEDLGEAVALMPKVFQAARLLPAPVRSGAQNAAPDGFLQQFLGAFTKVRQLLEKAKREQPANEWSQEEREDFLATTEWIVAEREAVGAIV